MLWLHVKGQLEFSGCLLHVITQTLTGFLIYLGSFVENTKDNGVTRVRRESLFSVEKRDCLSGRQ